jgi:hypothetical protein
MRGLLLVLLGLNVVSATAQQLANDDFKLSFSSTGLSSIKRVHDTYETDYASPGRTLGDVLLLPVEPAGARVTITRD